MKVLAAAIATVLQFAVVQNVSAQTLLEDDRLTEAACNGDAVRVRRYVRAGDKPTDKSMFCAVSFSANVEVLELLLDHQGNPDTTYRYVNALTGYAFEMSMLEFAVVGGQRPIMTALLAHHADVNLVFQAVMKDPVPYATTALALAAARGSIGTVELLLSRDANPSADSSAAVFAVVGNPVTADSTEILRLLIVKGADLKAKKEDKTACALASGEMLEILNTAGGCNE